MMLLGFIQVDTAGWLHNTREVKGPSCLGVMQSRKNLMRAQIVALILDAEKVIHTLCSLSSVVIVTHRFLLLNLRTP